MLIGEAMTEDSTGLTEYSPDGVDLTLIRWMLSLTPAERLEFLEQRVNDIIAIRELNART
jgi:hypothetical protein